MDYCLPCRRTLNGTVTCPECGAYDSDTAPSSDRSGDAPAADPPVWDALFGEGPGSLESPDVARPPTSSSDATAARHRLPPRLRKYGGRTLAAATFAMLGGLVAASLLSQDSADAQRALPHPEQASPDEPDADVTGSPTASPSPDRPATRPARGGGDRARGPAGTRRPGATATPPESPAPQAPAATGPPPPAQAGPTPRPSDDRPGQSASSPTATRPASPPASPSTSPSTSPSASPSAGPSASVSASPPNGPTRGTAGVPVPDGQRRG
ncbi:SCO2400 family protein [Streptomyces kurssanovii]|uniref:SCO2400 family protein n=1 Tax=Streptomyces kurssanovii TaxID=67312 RepID=UPI003F4D937D